MNFTLSLSSLLLVALWGLLYAAFHQAGKIDWYIGLHKLVWKSVSMLLWIIWGFLNTIIFRPVARRWRMTYSRYGRELRGYSIGVITSLICIILNFPKIVEIFAGK